MKTRIEIQDEFLGRFTDSTGQGFKLKHPTKTPLEIIDWVMDLLSSSTGRKEGWVSVEDELPKERIEFCLCFNGNAPQYNQHVFQAVWYEESKHFASIDKSNNFMGTITHWRLLPSPPLFNEGKEEGI